MNLFIYLFIIELFFGLNGKWLILGGISIRHWLFAVVFILIYAKTILTLVQKWKESEKPFSSFLSQELSAFSWFDFVLAGFLLLQGLWIVILPFLHGLNTPGAFKHGIQNGMSIFMYTLYFPSVYLLRNGKINWKNYRCLVKSCCVLVAFLHIFIYIMEQLYRNEPTYFMDTVFSFWNRLVLGNCDMPLVMMPMYSVRILYVFNIFILLSFYFIVGKTEKKYYLWSVLNIIALFTTGTRSLIVGTLAGICSFCFFDCFLKHWNRTAIKHIFIKAGCFLIVAIALDGFLFHGSNITRLASSLTFNTEALETGEIQTLEWESTKYSTQSEIRGTSNSNSTKILQLREISKVFLEHPWIGQGFSFSTSNLDMHFICYAVRVGVLGCLALFLFLGLAVKYILQIAKKGEKGVLPAIYAIVAVLIDVCFQWSFNSLVIAFSIYILLDLSYIDLQTKESALTFC